MGKLEWVQQKTARMTVGLLYPLCKERAKELELCSLKKGRFRVETGNMIIIPVYNTVINTCLEEVRVK